jgi:hydroxymethylbilane synthase
LTRLRIGTRGSALALAQTGQIAALLEANGVATELIVIRTSGDRLADVSLAKIGGKGLFIKELEEALARDEIDIAVHSMKDVPAALPDGFEIAAVPARASVEDVLVIAKGARNAGAVEPAGRGGSALDVLGPGARVGTGSLRRGAQLLALRPDLHVEPIRGNVDTRLRKVEEGEVDAVVLAAAGLARLGLDVAAAPLDVERFVPAPGQGALALEIRAGGPSAARVQVLHDPRSERECAAERRFSRELGASCVAPVAALARAAAGESTAGLELTGLVASLDGCRILRDRIAGHVAEAEDLGARLAARLIARGAREILDEIERTSGAHTT